MELLYRHPEECKTRSQTFPGESNQPNPINRVFVLSGQDEFLESGVHSIDFDFELPRGVGLPSTFQGQHGSICYFLVRIRFSNVL